MWAWPEGGRERGYCGAAGGGGTEMNPPTGKGGRMLVYLVLASCVGATYIRTCTGCSDFDDDRLICLPCWKNCGTGGVRFVCVRGAHEREREEGRAELGYRKRSG